MTVDEMSLGSGLLVGQEKSWKEIFHNFLHILQTNRENNQQIIGKLIVSRSPNWQFDLSTVVTLCSLDLI